MINAEKIVFEKQNYYTPSWSGVTTVKILEVLPKGKVRVKQVRLYLYVLYSTYLILLKLQVQAVENGKALRENVRNL